MARQIRIEHPDGSTDTLSHVSSEEEYEFGKQDQASLFTFRDEVSGITLNEAEDEVYLEDSNGNDEFGGILTDIVRGGPETELVVSSFEQYALDSQPTAAGNLYENVADTTILNDAIGSVSQLTAGTVNNVASGLTFVFSHASQAYKMRTVEGATDGELRYNPDKTVDYVDTLGADKTATTLSPSSQNIIGDIEASRVGGEEKVTHVRAVGAGEGEHQITAEATASSYSAGDRQIWRTLSNKDITDKATLQNFADTQIQELNTEYVEVDCNIKDVTVNLGDKFHVKYPEENVDHNLRVVELKRIVDKQGVRYNAVLSSRQKSRTDPESKQRNDVERFNMGFEGSPVTMTAGGGRQPVNSTLDYEFDFYYPDEVKYEHRVKLFVKGLAYRAYSKGAAAGGDHTHTVDVTHPSHAHDVTHPSHGHDITSAEFEHSHNINITTDLHDHGDGTLGADSHPHSDGTLGTASHGHTDGTLDTDSHGHTDGTLDTDSHGHTSGTLDADSHDHPQNITETSEPNNPHGSVVADGATISFPGDSIGWDELTTIQPGTDYEIGVIHVHATSAMNPIEVRARDDSATSVSDTSGSNENFTPRVEGVPLVGSSSGHDHGGDVSTSDGDGYSGTVTLIVPEDWGWVTVDYRSTGAPSSNISVTWMFLGEHTHEVNIGSPTGFDAPGVGGDTGSDAPGVGGNTGSDAPGVGGNTGSDSPDVGGDTGSSSPDVDGVTTDTSAGVSGSSDNTGGIRTSTTELGTTETSTTALGTTQSETSDASGDHTHSPNPGIIESFSGTRHYPQNCDVTVNGTSLGVSLGDGTGPFEQEVDLAGHLVPGQVNTIRISSDALGHIQSHLDIDVYRQILGNG